MSRSDQVVTLLAVTGLLTAGFLAGAVADHPDQPNEPQAQRHVVVLPQDVQWLPGPPSLPPEGHFAVLEGDPNREGTFTMRLRLPDGYRIPPHTHRRVERVTVVSGTLRLGMGATFDAQQMQSLPAGSFFVMPVGMQHYVEAQGQTVVQLTGEGPWTIDYINPADDPRR
jgi:quercetin dioxygenase-like cupin family protein